jgi:hypothetical protein
MGDGERDSSGESVMGAGLVVPLYTEPKAPTSPAELGD